jgi:hypothetical protein
LNLLKPLPGHVLNFTEEAFIYLDLALEFYADITVGVAKGAFNQVGNLWNATSRLFQNKFFGKGSDEF